MHILYHEVCLWENIEKHMVFRNHLAWLYFSCSIHLHHKRLLSTVYDIKTFKVASYASVGCNCIVCFGCFSWLQVYRLFDKMPAKFIYVMLRSATSFASLMQIVFFIVNPPSHSTCSSASKSYSCAGIAGFDVGSQKRYNFKGLGNFIQRCLQVASKT